MIGDEFYISMECGVQDAAAELGATVNVQGPDAFDATLQNPIIDAVVASGPDAILVAPNDVEASAGPLQRAQDAGIEVILVDTVVNDESIGASRIASDNFQGGVTAADALAELIGEEGTVMVINVNPGISIDRRAPGRVRGADRHVPGHRVHRHRVQQQRAGPGRRDRDGGAGRQPRPQRRLRHQPVLGPGHRHRPRPSRRPR